MDCGAGLSLPAEHEWMGKGAALPRLLVPVPLLRNPLAPALLSASPTTAII